MKVSCRAGKTRAHQYHQGNPSWAAKGNGESHGIWWPILGGQGGEAPKQAITLFCCMDVMMPYVLQFWEAWCFRYKTSLVYYGMVLNLKLWNDYGGFTECTKLTDICPQIVCSGIHGLICACLRYLQQSFPPSVQNFLEHKPPESVLVLCRNVVLFA